MSAPLSWLGIARLGLVQTALGAIVVLTTSTMNRVMVVELALPAMLPGALVALHYAVQIVRPRFGHGSDLGGRRTPWIVGGMAVLALGGVGAAVATATMATNQPLGIALAVAAFLLIGAGVGASGTSLLALLATSVAPSRRAAAATVVWVMMIAGFVVTAGVAGHYLDPFSTQRLIVVTAVVSGVAFLVTLAAVAGVEARGKQRVTASAPELPKPAFRQALAGVWADPQSRRFTIFVFVSMLAYSSQDLILEPFAGAVFGMTPGESTKLSGLQNAGVLIGMIIVGLAGSSAVRRRLGSLRAWSAGGCVASALALVAIGLAGLGSGLPLRACVFALGVSNGAFAVAAIGSMMALAGGGTGSGGASREGIRIGVWGSAQAIAFGLGGFLGTVGVDSARTALDAPTAYAAVFFAEGLLFLAAARVGWGVGRDVEAKRRESDRMEDRALGGFHAPTSGRIAS